MTTQVKVNRPVLRISTLAIHLTKGDERKSFAPNLQTNFYPTLATEIKSKLELPATAVATVNGNGISRESKGGKQIASEEANGHGGGVGGGSTERHHALLVQMIATELGCVLMCARVCVGSGSCLYSGAWMCR